MLGHHGGNLDAARRSFPGAPEPWIDLSTGINPFPYPVGELPADVWERLPEPATIARLEAAAAQAYRVPPGVHVVAAPGTQSLIQWLPRLLEGRRVGIVGPTYGEYAAAWCVAGAQVETVPCLTSLAGFDAAVVCNPNNPDGRVHPVDALLGFAESAGAGELRWLVVDEAFADFVPDCSLAPRLLPERVIVLRSFGKAFGLAGLRLGFALCGGPVAARLREAIGPWAVSGPAAAVGMRALADTARRAAAGVRLAEASQRLDALLARSGWDILGGTPLFRLARHRRARALFEALGRAGILTRPFDDAQDRLRFGIPADDAWPRLEAALSTSDHQ